MTCSILIAIYTLLFWVSCEGYQSASNLKENIHLSPDETYDFDLLPSDVQEAIGSLSDDTLMEVMELAVTSVEIFGEIVLYLSLSWAETACEWIVDISGMVEDGWDYFATGEIVEDAQCVFDDIIGTVGDTMDFFCEWFCDEIDEIPIQLLKELQYLMRNKKSRNLAFLKYTAWKVNGIIWDSKFVKKLGFENDDHLMETLMSGLKRLYKSEFINIDCEIMDPVELINPHYVSTINILSSFLSSLPNRETTIAITFSAEVCASYFVGGCIGGGMGFAIDGYGNGLIYESKYAGLSFASDANWGLGDVDANFVVTLGIFKDMSSVEGFCVTAGVGANFPGGFSVEVSVSVAESDDGYEPIAVNFAAAFDLTGTEIMPGVAISLTAETCTGIAKLVSSECAVAAGGGGKWEDIVESKTYPKIGPSFDSHYHILGGSTGTALISVPKDYPNLMETVEYEQGLILNVKNKYHNNFTDYLWVLFSFFILSTIVCYAEFKRNIFVKKEINNIEETQPLIKNVHF